MRQVDYKRFLCGPEFERWRGRANKARKKLLAGGKPSSFATAIWKDLKQMLIDGNHDKCMYCEGQYVAGTHDDAEHYRPKGDVTEWDGRAGERRPVKHDGYYSLAYEWQNLLLACTKCNSPHPDGEGNQPHPGKLNDFPISAGKQRRNAPGPDPDKWWEELKVEEPLLLHPYFDRCEDHFEARLNGVIYGRTPQGRATIRTCDLNRPKLCAARDRAEELIRRDAAIVCNLFLNDKPFDVHLVQPEVQFSVYLADRLFHYAEALVKAAKGRRVNLKR